MQNAPVEQKETMESLLMKIMSKRVSEREEGSVSNKERRLALVERKLKLDRKSTRLNSSHLDLSRMPSSA